MCFIEICAYRCGHKKESKLYKCDTYYEQKAERGVSICRALGLSRQSRNCGQVNYVDRDVRSDCSVECQDRRRRQRDAREWARASKYREKQLEKRSKSSAREYEKNKKKETEAEQRRDAERAAAQNEAIGFAARLRATGLDPGSRDPDFMYRNNIWPFGSNKYYFHDSPPGVVPDPPTREELLAPSPPSHRPHPAQASKQCVPPPRLADRPILPQAYRPRPGPPSPPLPSTSSSSGTKANIGSPPPSANGDSTSLSRSNGSRLYHEHVGTDKDPRTRIAKRQGQGQAKPEAQESLSIRTAAKQPVLVSRPSGVPQPSRARISFATPPTRTPASSPPRRQEQQDLRAPVGARFNNAAPSRGQQPYQFRPPVPQKDGPPASAAWRPPHPKMAPAPLAVRPVARDGGNGYKPDPMMMRVPRRKPVGSGNARSNAPPPAAAAVPGYRPNPMFNNNNNNRSGQNPAAAAAANNYGGSAQPAPRAAPPKKGSSGKKSFFKRLVGGSSSASLKSVEFVSADAARIERGSPPKSRLGE